MSDIPSAQSIWPRRVNSTTHTFCAMRNASSIASPKPVSAGRMLIVTTNGFTVVDSSAKNGMGES